ncbi:MAG TPA: glycosyltransferase [Thermoanaerobaculia bacterium]|nr:glycosyltransferase [Thermoanaerobaculia bacterium]
MSRTLRGEPDVSVVVPIVERYGDLRQLYQEFSAELTRLGQSSEFIFVVDDSQRGALAVLRELQKESEQISILQLSGSFGESAALMLGLERARGEKVMTLAAYFQVEPRGTGPALAALDDGVDLVAGRRFPRIDSFFNRVQSRLFHWIVRRLTSTDFHDISCGFKVMRRRVTRELHIYGGQHRFIPILAMNRGFTVREMELPQRDEDRSTRFHGTGAYLGRLLDILTIFFLVRFTRTPLRFFGLLGLFLFLSGFATDLIVAMQKVVWNTEIADRPMLLLGVLLMVLGMQTLSLGLLGEMIIFTHARNVRDYRVAEVIRGVPPAPPLDIATEPAEPEASSRTAFQAS